MLSSIDVDISGMAFNIVSMVRFAMVKYASECAYNMLKTVLV